MKFPFFIAKRYLFTSKSKNVVNIISYISLFGVSIGTAALVVVLAVFNGFGGLASLLVGSGEYLSGDLHNSATLFAIYLTLLIRLSMDNRDALGWLTEFLSPSVVIRLTPNG